MIKEKLTSAASADEPKIVEFGDLILHQRGGVSQLRATVLVVAGSDRHQSPVANLAEGDHFERHWQSFVGPPVSRQLTAQKIRRTCNRESRGHLYHKESFRVNLNPKRVGDTCSR